MKLQQATTMISVLLYLELSLGEFNFPPGQTRAKYDPNASNDVNRRCHLQHRVFRSGYIFNDNCNRCECFDGIISCNDGILPGCFYKVGESTKPPPLSCEHLGVIRLQGEIFTTSDGCYECWCENSEIQCSGRRICK